MKLLLLLCLVGISLASVARITLRKKTSLQEKLISQGKYAAFLAQRKIQQSLARINGINPRIRDHGSETTFDYSDNEYLAEVFVGTPSQKFLIDIDTGSTDFWLIAPTCQGDLTQKAKWWKIIKANVDDCHNNPCANKTFFQPSQSSSFNNKTSIPFSIQYGSGSCSGYTANESMTFDGISLTNQIFGLATFLDSDFDCDPTDGIFGLGYPEIAAFDNPPPINSMINEGLLDEPLFAIYLNRTATVGEIGGEVSVGRYNTALYTGEIYWQPVTKEGYWQFEIDSVTAGSTVLNKGYQVISDSGTSWLICSAQSDCDAIAEGVGAKYHSEAQVYEITCDISGLSPISFNVGGQKFTASPASYVYNSQQGYCFMGMAQDDLSFAGLDWILGDVFIRDWYSIYDFGSNQIGLAKAINT